MLNFSSIIGKFIKISSQRELSQIKSTVKKINDLETEIKAIPDQNFATRSMELKEKFNKGMGLEFFKHFHSLKYDLIKFPAE